MIEVIVIVCFVVGGISAYVLGVCDGKEQAERERLIEENKVLRNMVMKYREEA